MSTLSTTNSSLTTERSRLEAKTLIELLDEFLATKKSSQTKLAYQKDIVAFFQ
jgi:hypothetical protein